MIGVPMRLQLSKSITALAFFLFAGLALAQAPKTPLTLKPTAPGRYVVVRGDTLWGIAERYTDSPWRWPELWRLNKEEIKNPDLIYPGDVIVLDRGQARLSLLKTVKLEPRVRDEGPAVEAIPSIPPKVIEPFLSRPIVVERDGLDNAPTIVATEENHVVLGAGSQAYVEGIGNSKEDTWYVYRRGKALVDPDTERTLGYEGVYLGTAHVLRPGNPATITLTSVTQEVMAGDKLIPAGKSLPMVYAPHAPSVFIKGRVIDIYEGLAKVGEAGPQSIVALNRGKADGLDVGSVLALYRYGATVRDVYVANKAADATIKVPDQRYGLVFVFRVFDHVSYALVMRITRPVQPLDVVETP